MVGVGDPHQVGAVGKTREQILPGGVGGGGGDHLTGVHHTVTVGIQRQGHGHPGDAGLVRVLGPVAVGVEVNGVAQHPGAGGPRPVPEVGVQVDVTGGQHDRHRGLVVEHPAAVRVAGLHVAGRRVHLHGVAARGVVVEDVAAVGSGDRRVDFGLVGAVLVVVDEQPHRHAAQPWFARVLHAVAVGVDPHPVADGTEQVVPLHVGRRAPVVAEVGGQVLLSGAQGHDVGHDLVAEVAVPVDRVGGPHQPGGQGARVHVYLIGPRREPGEEVPAVGVGHRRVEEHGAVDVPQPDHPVPQARLSGVLVPVPVLVEPQVVAQAPQPIQSGVPGAVHLPRGEGGPHGGTRGGIGVAVGAVQALVLEGEGVPGQLAEHHVVVAGGEAREEVAAIAAGGGGRHQGVGAGIQLHRYPGDPRLPRVLDAVAVQILPDPVAEGGGETDAHVWVDLHLEIWAVRPVHQAEAGDVECMPLTLGCGDEGARRVGLAEGQDLRCIQVEGQGDGLRGESRKESRIEPGHAHRDASSAGATHALLASVVVDTELVEEDRGLGGAEHPVGVCHFSDEHPLPVGEPGASEHVRVPGRVVVHLHEIRTAPSCGEVGEGPVADADFRKPGNEGVLIGRVEARAGYAGALEGEFAEFGVGQKGEILGGHG